jgi:NADH-quinone oxidoreductase subunit G
MGTVTLTIDGREITVDKGKTVLQAAIESGIQVPFYCYHPGIGIDGSCRVCVVKIENMPKLQTSCSTVCAEGMVVSTSTAEVVAARAGIFEFLLINHPLDCPVCDKGGECPLQDFSYSFGPDKSRMDFPRREFDGDGVKADVDFGPTLMLNRNRCIMCTRCVRFMRDVEGDAQINIIDRGYGSEIATFQEEGVHSLLSGNLMDVCPVGAITTRDYRFKSRPWDNPKAADTICTQCSRGCNVTAWIKARPEWAKGSQLVRFTPRFAPEVNGYWMCDIGRFNYHWIEGDRRVRRPLARRADGTLQPAGWHDAVTAIADRLRHPGVRFLLSAHASNEELFLFGALADRLGGSSDAITVTWRMSEKLQPERTQFVVTPVDAPNVNGARAFGLVPGVVGDPQNAPGLRALREAVDNGSVQTLYVFDPGPEGSLGDSSWIVEARAAGRIAVLIVQGVLQTPLAQAADFVLPGATYVEKEASYTNDKGRLQGTSRVIAPPGDAMEDWRIIVELASAANADLVYPTSEAVRAAIGTAAVEQPGLSGIDRLTFFAPVEARHWLQTSNPSERWKWDFMYQDLPPTKFSGEPFSTNFDVIPLKEVK